MRGRERPSVVKVHRGVLAVEQGAVFILPRGVIVKL